MTKLAPFAALLALTSGCVVMGNGDAKTEGRPITAFDGIKSTDVVDVIVRDGARIDGVDVTCDDNLLGILDTRVKDGVLVVGFPPGTAAMPRATCELVTGNTQLIDVVSTGSADIRLSGPAWSLEHVRTTGSGDVSISLQGTLDAAEDGSATPEDSDLLGEETESGDLTEAPETEAGFVLEALPAAAELDIETTGSGDVRVDGIDTRKVFLTTTGSGDVTLAGDANLLDARTTGSGDVHARQLHVNRVELVSTGSGDMTAWAAEDADVRSSGSGDIRVHGSPDQRDRNSTGSGDIRFP